MVHTGIKDLKKKPFGGAWSIHDSQVVECRDQAIRQFLKDQSSLNFQELSYGLDLNL